MNNAWYTAALLLGILYTPEWTGVTLVIVWECDQGHIPEGWSHIWFYGDMLQILLQGAWLKHDEIKNMMKPSQPVKHLQYICSAFIFCPKLPLFFFFFFFAFLATAAAICPMKISMSLKIWFKISCEERRRRKCLLLLNTIKHVPCSKRTKSVRGSNITLRFPVWHSLHSCPALCMWLDETLQWWKTAVMIPPLLPRVHTVQAQRYHPHLCVQRRLRACIDFDSIIDNQCSSVIYLLSWTHHSQESSRLQASAL